MNTKNKIIAILMAGIVAMAVGVPAMVSAHAQKDVTVDVTVKNCIPDVEWKWEWQNPSHDDLDTTDKIELGYYQPMYKCVLVSDCNGNDDIIEIIWHLNATDDSVIYHTEKLSSGDFTLVTKPADPANPTDPCWVELKVQVQNPTLYGEATGTKEECYFMYNGTWDHVDLDAGDYKVQVQAIDNQGAKSAWFINNVTVLEHMQLDVDVAAVSFGDVENFVHKVVAGDDVWGAPNATIHNTGNIPIDVEVSCPGGLTCTTPATCDAKVIPEGDLDAKVDAAAEQYISACFDVNLASLATTNLDLSIDIGHSTGQPVPPGSYSGMATVTAMAACP